MFNRCLPLTFYLRSTRILQKYRLNIIAMSTTSNSSFNDKTEGFEVASAFASRIYGKTVLITGVNTKGVGGATAEAFVRLYSLSSTFKD